MAVCGYVCAFVSVYVYAYIHLGEWGLCEKNAAIYNAATRCCCFSLHLPNITHQSPFSTGFNRRFVLWERLNETVVTWSEPGSIKVQLDRLWSACTGKAGATSRLLMVSAVLRLLPGKSHPTAGPIGISEDAGGDDLAEGLEHALQLLFIHRHRQVGDVEVGGVLLLLLCGDKGQGRIDHGEPNNRERSKHCVSCISLHDGRHLECMDRTRTASGTGDQTHDRLAVRDQCEPTRPMKPTVVSECLSWSVASFALVKNWIWIWWIWKDSTPMSVTSPVRRSFCPQRVYSYGVRKQQSEI